MTLATGISAAPRIALIHATTAAIAPAVAGMNNVFPEAEVWNILDDKLLPDADANGGLAAHLVERMNRLIDLALADGAAGVLLTCSIYGSVAHGIKADVPVLSPDEAAFETALAGGYGKILMVASFETALNDSMARFTAFLQANGSTAKVLGEPVPAALTATKAGDISALTAALIEAVKPFVGSVDAVLLGQYSLAPAATAVEEALGVPVISGPQAAALKLKAAVTAGRP
jgi:phosphohistidine swiveling domain-containing protein